MEECESLLVLLGVDPTLLQARQGSVQLLAISSWFLDQSAAPNDEDSDNDCSNADDNPYSDNESDTDEAAELQELMDRVDGNEFSFTPAQDDKLTRLACAAMAITSDEMAKM